LEGSSLSLNSFKVVISGSLADRTIKPYPSPPPDTFKKDGQQHRVVFQVQVENRSGEVFWFQEESAEDLQAVQAAEQILKNLRFETQEGYDVSSGRIEIYSHHVRL
jgi:hypothetical protein